MFTVGTIQIPIQASEFHNKLFFEHVDVKLIDEMLQSNLLKPHEIIQLSKYKKLVQNNKATVKYKHSTKNKHPTGRVFVDKGVGLQMITKDIRNYLAKDKYVQLDIVNAYPTILSQLCKKHNIKCDYLSFYVKYQNQVFDSINTNNGALKELFLILTHCGQIKHWIKKHNLPLLPLGEFPYEYQHEARIIAQTIHDKNMLIQTGKSKSSTLSKVLQFHENNILTHMYNYLCAHGFINQNDCILCFDSILIKKNDKINDKLLSKLSKYIAHQTKFDLKFALKDMTRNIYTKRKPEVCMIDTSSD